ncbi:MAG: flagellar hook-length control protein FliK [Endozoicomonadaceae bacterium]|nr:flagellar hook-length control protein FliK [Endozoicomonadaceae bacterium]
MEGSTVITDSSLLPSTMPVTTPLQPQSAPTTEAGSVDPGQKQAFAELFSEMLSAEVSTAPSELDLVQSLVEVAPLESGLPAEQPVLTTVLEPWLNPTADLESALLPSLLTPETVTDSEFSDLPTKALTDPASILPAIISKVLSEQAVPAKEMTSALQTLKAGTYADNVMAEKALVLPAVIPLKLTSQVSQPDIEPAVAKTEQGSQPLQPSQTSLLSLSEPPRIMPSVPAHDGTGALPTVELASVPDAQLQARSIEVQPMGLSVYERSVSVSVTETPAASMIEKPVVARTVLDPASLSQLGDRVMVMINRDLQEAHIRMDPPGLGHLKIALAIDGDQVSVQFTASQHGLRELIIQQTERLRQYLEEQQLNLVSVDVATDQGRDPQHAADEHAQTTSASFLSADVSSDKRMLPAAMQQHSAGILDIYA